MVAFLVSLSFAIGLSMDAFAVSVGKGISLFSYQKKYALKTGVLFGLFQFLMPLSGWRFASFFSEKLFPIAHILSFIMLFFIGVHMAFLSKKEEPSPVSFSFRLRLLLPLALATSVDALFAGVTFAFSGYSFLRTLYSALCIGTVTCTLSSLGVRIGAFFGHRFQKPAELFGGILLILLSFYTLLSK